MKAKVIDGGWIVDVEQDAHDPHTFIEMGENGRLVSDYHISQLEFLEDDVVENSIYENLWVVRNGSGRLLMFTEEPVRRGNYERWDGGSEPIPLLTKFPGIDLKMFDDLKYEDEPVRVRMILVRI